ncbi:MAG: phosphotransferase, partial [Chloroflexi bacterium]|nr:phosphotransferase [Chloroflexota bacterium]
MSAHRWTPPDYGDLDALVAALDRACPAAAPVRELWILGEGYFSVAVASKSGYVFRLGTSPDVAARYRKEWNVLPWLATKELPIAIPDPCCLLDDGGAFPYGGIAYPMLGGRPLPAVLARSDRRALARQIAGFNLAMHRLSVDEGRAAGLPDGRDADRRWLEAYRESSVAALRYVLDPVDHAR